MVPYIFKSVLLTTRRCFILNWCNTVHKNPLNVLIRNLSLSCVVWILCSLLTCTVKLHTFLWMLTFSWVKNSMLFSDCLNHIFLQESFQYGWSSSLLSSYYPLLMSSASLIVCFWAEVCIFYYILALFLANVLIIA